MRFLSWYLSGCWYKQELAPGCGADSTLGLTKPERWFEKVITSPSQTEWKDV